MKHRDTIITGHDVTELAVESQASVHNPQDAYETGFTKKDIVRIIAAIIAAVAIVAAIIWLITRIVPLLIGLIVFIPWLGAALAGGANI